MGTDNLTQIHVKQSTSKHNWNSDNNNFYTNVQSTPRNHYRSTITVVDFVPIVNENQKELNLINRDNNHHKIKIHSVFASFSSSPNSTHRKQNNTHDIMNHNNLE